MLQDCDFFLMHQDYGIGKSISKEKVILWITWRSFIVLFTLIRSVVLLLVSAC